MTPGVWLMKSIWDGTKLVDAEAELPTKQVRDCDNTYTDRVLVDKSSLLKLMIPIHFQ